MRQLDLFSPGFCLCGSVELFLLWKNFLSLFCLSFPPPPFFSDSTFLSFSVHFSQSLLHLPPSQFPLSQSLCSLRPALHHLSSLHVLSHLSLPPILFVPISALLSMAATLCFPPPVFFSLYSPRMHLFKACFTKTVLKRKERSLESSLVLALRMWTEFCDVAALYRQTDSARVVVIVGI